MTELAREPGTGFHVFHVIPDAWGPFVDIRAMYQSLARRAPWISVIKPNEFRSLQLFSYDHGLLWDDPRVAFVVWDLSAEVYTIPRKALVTYVYSEALAGDLTKLLPAHQSVWARFVVDLRDIDGVFGHTPLAAELLARSHKKAFLMPVGWDAEAMGAPRWDAPKHKELVFYGSVVGRREILLPYLLDTFNRRRDQPLLVSISGAYGRGLLGELDTSQASLYIAHSDVESYSTWRLWQVASTSAALLSEPGDTWPFVIEEHFVGIQKFEIGNAWNVSLQIKELLTRREHNLSVARAAHEIARQFTVDLIQTRYLLPALAELADSRG